MDADDRVEANTTELRERARLIGADYDGPLREELIRSLRRKLAEDPTYRESYCETCGADLNQSVRLCPFCGTEFYAYSSEEDDEIREADAAMEEEISARRLDQREAEKAREAAGAKRAKRPSTKRHVGKLREPPKPQTWGKERRAAEAKKKTERKSARRSGAEPGGSKRDGDKIHDPKSRQQELLAALPMTERQVAALNGPEQLSLLAALGVGGRQSWRMRSAERVAEILRRQDTAVRESRSSDTAKAREAGQVEPAPTSEVGGKRPSKAILPTPDISGRIAQKAVRKSTKRSRELF
jgi:hypothetical protein